MTPSKGGFKDSIVYQFKGPDGEGPSSALIADGSGVLYGKTVGGGARGEGAVFALEPNGSTYAESVLYSFRGGGDNDAQAPQSSLLIDAKGNLYGTTAAGGEYLAGAVFELKRDGNHYSEVLLHSFEGYPTGDGACPYSSLIADRDRALYGTTGYGGTAK